MPTTATRTGILRSLTRFRREQSGVAAIEFAMIVPIMIGKYLMLNETANGMRAARKVTMTSRVMADLVTRVTAPLTNGARDDVFAAAKPIMAPFKDTDAGYRLTSVRVDATGKGCVDWSEVKGAGYSAFVRGTKANGGGPVVPAGLLTPDTSFIMAEVKYVYTPAVGKLITGPIDLVDNLVMRPRAVAFVERTGVPTAAPTC